MDKLLELDDAASLSEANYTALRQDCAQPSISHEEIAQFSKTFTGGFFTSPKEIGKN